MGLLSENSSISFSFEVGPGETELIKGVAKAIEIKNLGDHVLSIQHSSYVLTEAGKELFAIIFDSDYSKMSSEYLSDCMKEITAHGMSFDDKTAGKLRLSIKIVDCS